MPGMIGVSGIILPNSLLAIAIDWSVSERAMKTAVSIARALAASLMIKRGLPRDVGLMSAPMTSVIFSVSRRYVLALPLTTLMSRTSVSDAHVEVDSVRRRLKEAEAELNKKLTELRPRLTELLGQMPEANDAEADYIKLCEVV